MEMTITANYIQPRIEIYLSSNPHDKLILSMQEARDFLGELSIDPLGKLPIEKLRTRSDILIIRIKEGDNGR